jgi:hypothetical protein
VSICSRSSDEMNHRDCHHERSEGSAVRPVPGLVRWQRRHRHFGSGFFPGVRKEVGAVATCVLLLASFAAAQNITGTVTNGTTGKPSAGDEVELLALSQGMQQVGTTKTDAQGRF